MGDRERELKECGVTGTENVERETKRVRDRETKRVWGERHRHCGVRDKESVG